MVMPSEYVSLKLLIEAMAYLSPAVSAGAMIAHMRTGSGVALMIAASMLVSSMAFAIVSAACLAPRKKKGHNDGE